jgi:hypothetical protein
MRYKERKFAEAPFYYEPIFILMYFARRSGE